MTDQIERIARLEANLTHIERAVTEMAASLKAIEQQSARWKGAFGVILVIGGFAGSVATVLMQWALRKVGG